MLLNSGQITSTPELRGFPRILDRHLDAARLLVGKRSVHRIGPRDDHDVHTRGLARRP